MLSRSGVGMFGGWSCLARCRRTARFRVPRTIVRGGAQAPLSAATSIRSLKPRTEIRLASYGAKLRVRFARYLEVSQGSRGCRFP